MHASFNLVEPRSVAPVAARIPGALPEIEF